MGVPDKHTTMDVNEDWPAGLRFRKIRHRRMRRSQSPSREVSPVPSYYSEPISVRQRNDVTLRLPPLLRWAHQEEEDDSEDTQSLKSLPTVMSTLAFDPKVKRSHHLSKEQVISGLNLPPLVTSKCTLVVKGTGCSKPRGFLPVIKSKSLDRPPCRAGCRPDKLKASVGQSCQMLPSTIAVSEEPPGPRITFHSPVVNAEYSVTPDITKETWQTFRTHQSLRPVMKKAQVTNRQGFKFLLEERYFPCPREPHLLEPLSGFQEHLRHQLVNSPLPHPTLLPVQPHLLINQRDYPHHGLHGSRMERTVELCNSQEKRLPRITMTCPTPSPKHLQHPGKRHVA
uniref:Si:dkey-39a18.1 n=1 Tax=Astyanax mexicanus TaxID=7994 RepID=A0A8B9K3B0_ASTMX